MNFVSHDVLAVLKEREALPENRQAVYLSGSLVRGWGNATSDLDVYVISDELPDAVAGQRGPNPNPDRGPRWEHSFYVDDRRWDVEYWTDSLVDKLLHAVSWGVLEAGRSVGADLAQRELAFIQRVACSHPIEGAEWVARRVADFEGSAVRTMVGLQFLDSLDRCTEDAAGMLEAKDFESATLVARAAVGHAVDALLASRGEFTEQPKWRARRVRLVGEPGLPFNEYWDLETMRTFDPNAPQDFVERALAFCQRLADVIVL